MYRIQLAPIEVDLVTARGLVAELRERITQSSDREILLDCAHATFLEPDAFDALVPLATFAADRGQLLVIRRPADPTTCTPSEPVARSRRPAPRARLRFRDRGR